ncbi:MAG TPA: hypothetical protein VIG51_11445 [Candidatus Baltobacteraceae bacterium]|jgi:hypothetical protein
MFEPLTITIGHDSEQPQVVLDVLDYQHPDIAEPEGLDLMRCRVTAHAPPIDAGFEIPIGLWELEDLQEYLAQIRSGNGPSQSFILADGLLTLSFAPSKRGPVLCAVMIKSVDASHLRLEYLVMLEPESISRTLMQLTRLQVRARSG